MILQGARDKAKIANAAALAAEKDRDAAEAVVASLEAVLASKKKKQRTCTSVAAEEEGASDEENDWDLSDHRREMSRVMNRRGVDMLEAPAEEPVQPRTGKTGFLHHSRLGLIGALAYWAGGSLDMGVTLVVALCVQLNQSCRARAGCATEQSKPRS